jgi:hypothetical protein
MLRARVTGESSKKVNEVSTGAYNSVVEFVAFPAYNEHAPPVLYI